VEIVRRTYSEWSKGNFTAGTQAYDPNILLVIGPDFADLGVFTGTEALQRYMRAFLEPWEVLTIEGKEFRAVDDSVLVRVLQRGTGLSSRIPVEQAYFQLWTFRGGKVVRIDSILDEKEALEAAGLSE
jgi:ketosteroid isomerase-like protein